MKNTYQFHIEKMKEVLPSMTYQGENNEAWRIEARKQLGTLLGMEKYHCPGRPAIVEYDVQREGFREIRFVMETEEGYFVPCHLWLPEGIRKPPVMICLQGHSPGMHISLGRTKPEDDPMPPGEGDRDFSVRAVREGFAAVALEQRNFGELQGEGRCLYSSLTALLQGRTTIGERVHDVSVCIDVLKNQFAELLDTENISCMGNSGGGTATAYAAALEDRLKLAMTACAMCTFRDSIGDVPHCACNYVPHIAEYFDMNDLMAMAAPKCFIQVSGTYDPENFPLEGAKTVFEKGSRVYEQLGIKDRCVLVIGNAGHRFYADDAWPWVHKLLKR